VQPSKGDENGSPGVRGGVLAGGTDSSFRLAGVRCFPYVGFRAQQSEDLPGTLVQWTADGGRCNRARDEEKEAVTLQQESRVLKWHYEPERGSN
jgi:hypothetical protein